MQCFYEYPSQIEINSERVGFDVKLFADSKTEFGSGIVFNLDSENLSKPEKSVLLCNVLLGNSFQESSNSPYSPLLYDSILTTVNNSKIVIVNQNYRVYPSYLISY